MTANKFSSDVGFKSYSVYSDAAEIDGIIEDMSDYELKMYREYMELLVRDASKNNGEYKTEGPSEVFIPSEAERAAGQTMLRLGATAVYQHYCHDFVTIDLMKASQNDMTAALARRNIRSFLTEHNGAIFMSAPDYVPDLNSMRVKALTHEIGQLSLPLAVGFVRYPLIPQTVEDADSGFTLVAEKA